MRARTILYRRIVAIIFATAISNASLPALAQGFWDLEIEDLFEGACQGGELHERPFFTLCIHPDRKIATWVAYELNEELLGGHTDRTDDFRPDTDLNKDDRALLTDYEGSGFDRGHMGEAESFVRNRQTMSATFILSNMAPQTPTLNRGRWRSLEKDVRSWAFESGTSLVFTGSIFVDRNDNIIDPRFRIGEGDVAVPTHSFKAILRDVDDEIEAIAFVLPNKRKKNPGPNSRWAVSVDELEELLNQDLFAFVEDDVEDEIEANFTTPEIFE